MLGMKISHRYSKQKTMHTDCATAEDKKWWVEMWHIHGGTQEEFCFMHSGNYETFRGWCTKYNTLQHTGMDLFHDHGGHPELLDEPAKKKVKLELESKVLAQKCPDRHEVSAALGAAAGETLNRRHIGHGTVAISETSRRNFEKEFDLSFRKTQFKTEARTIAEADLRNVLSMVALAYAFSENLLPNMIFNWDATQYTVRGDPDVEKLCIKGGGGTHLPTVSESNGKLDILIKYWHYHNAAGELSPSVFIISDDSLSEDAFSILPIPGLNATSTQDVGYLAIAKTRCGNVDFFRWFAKTIVIPFVEKTREVCQAKVLYTAIKGFMC